MKGCTCRFLKLLPGSAYSEDWALFRVNVHVPSALPCSEDLLTQRTWQFSG